MALFPEVFCDCGESILFGPCASEEERMAPMCSTCERLAETALASILRDFEDDGVAPSDPLVTEP